MVKEFSGKEFKTPRGSLRSLRVSSPMLVMVVVTFRFSNPTTSALGVEILRDKPGAAETATAEATREISKAEEENIVVKTIREAISLGPWGGRAGLNTRYPHRRTTFVGSNRIERMRAQKLSLNANIAI